MSKERYYEPAPDHIDVAEFRKVVDSRRSVRKFTDKPIPAEVLDDCLDMAMLAPNSSNLQQWEFYVVKSPDKKAKLVEACLNQNAAGTAAELIVIVARTTSWREHARLTLEHWPQPSIPKIVKDYYGRLAPFYYGQGPLGSWGRVKQGIALVTGLFKPVPRGPYTATDMKIWAAKSVALASENLMLALRAHGFDSCPMEGFDEVRVKRLLSLPKDAFVVMVLGAGERARDGVYYPRLRFDRQRFVHQV
jgi:nitroreductase